MYPRGGACTVSVTYPTYGFAAEKDIHKVVSDGEINPTKIPERMYFRLMQNDFYAAGSIRAAANVFRARTIFLKKRRLKRGTADI